MVAQKSQLWQPYFLRGGGRRNSWLLAIRTGPMQQPIVQLLDCWEQGQWQAEDLLTCSMWSPPQRRHRPQTPKVNESCTIPNKKHSQNSGDYYKVRFFSVVSHSHSSFSHLIHWDKNDHRCPKSRNACLWCFMLNTEVFSFTKGVNIWHQTKLHALVFWEIQPKFVIHLLLKHPQTHGSHFNGPIRKKRVDFSSSAPWRKVIQTLVFPTKMRPHDPYKMGHKARFITPFIRVISFNHIITMEKTSVFHHFHPFKNGC